MRWIPEERLREILADVQTENWSLEDLLINSLEEFDQITVTKLRPMSEAPRDGSEILGYLPTEIFIVVYCYKNEWLNEFDDKLMFSDNDFLGWIPMPIYKPEQK